MQDLAELIEQVVTGLGFQLVTVESSPRGRLLRVFIDIVDGVASGEGAAVASGEGAAVASGEGDTARGVSVDDCVAVSNQLTRVFEVENIDYDRLEVSSPGLDRPLIKPADFERFAGHEIRLRTSVPIDNQRNFTGVLQGLREGAVIVDTEKGELRVAFEDVDKARLVPKF